MPSLARLTPLHAFMVAMTLGACAGTTTQLAPVPREAIEAEEEKQRGLALEDNERQQARLDSLAYPILARSTSLCPGATGPLLGLRLATIHNYEKEWQPAAARVLGVNDTLTVVGVVPGSPAFAAGLRPGDRIMSLGNTAIPSGPKSTIEFAKALEELAEVHTTSTTQISYVRTGGRRASALTLTPVCAYGTVLLNTGELNAYADGERIYLTSAMMRFTSDDELQVVIAHELAHNAMNHIKARKKNALLGGILGAIADVFMATQGVNTGGYYTSRYASLGAQTFSQDFEREADYVGMYALALAGGPLETAPTFWRHMAQADPKSIRLAFTHPTTAERFVRMERSLAEIRGKQSRQVALLPEMKGESRPDAAAAAQSLPNVFASAPATVPPARPSAAIAAPTTPTVPEPEAAAYVDGSEDLMSSNEKLREAVDEAIGMGIIEDVREVELGQLSAMTGPRFGSAFTDYYLAGVLTAYLGIGEAGAIELWTGHEKLGVYTAGGLTRAHPVPDR